MLKYFGKIDTNDVHVNFNPSISSKYYFIRHVALNGIINNKNSITGKVLDFGCGLKPYKDLFSTTEYIGLDYYSEGHDHSNEQIDVFYDGKNIPFDDKSFNSVISTEVFEHVFDLDIALKELNRILVNNGIILITCPFVFPEHETPNDFARYTQFALKHIFEQHGFKIIKYEKGGNTILTIAQLITIFISEKTSFLLSKNKIFHYLYEILIIFFNFFGVFFNKVFTSSDALYLSNIVVAEKVNDLKKDDKN